MKFWDMCAAEALMKARFGIITDKDRNQIEYLHKTDDYTIPNGVIFGQSELIYDACYERVKDYLINLKVERGHV